jgi:hypothetical protein
MPPKDELQNFLQKDKNVFYQKNIKCILSKKESVDPATRDQHHQPSQRLEMLLILQVCVLIAFACVNAMQIVVAGKMLSLARGLVFG